jgi:hypothetical protein
MVYPRGRLPPRWPGDLGAEVQRIGLIVAVTGSNGTVGIVRPGAPGALRPCRQPAAGGTLEGTGDNLTST